MILYGIFNSAGTKIECNFIHNKLVQILPDIMKETEIDNIDM